jgi:hypothetical protein
VQEQHQNANQAHAETAMCWRTIFEEVKVGLQAFRLKTFLLDLLNQCVKAVLALSTGGDLGATPD